MTSADLSRPGWRVDSEALDDAVFVAGGRPHAARDVEGVVGLVPCIFEQELVDLRPQDRSYAASEMTALLLWWLATLDCPKLNPPSAGCLSGPAWRPERWHLAASAAGLPVAPLRRGTGPQAPPEDAAVARVTLVGHRSFGAADPELHRRARALADEAGVGVLGVTFEERRGEHLFRSANLFPALDPPAASGALLEYFDAAVPA
jgi:hypothetical protein